MKFPLLTAVLGGLALAGAIESASGQTPATPPVAPDAVPAPAAAPSGTPAYRLTLFMDNKRLDHAATQLVLLPSTDSRRLSIEFPAVLPPSGPAVRTDESGGTIFDMPLNAKFLWHVSAGTAVPRTLTSIDLVPPDGGQPVSVTASIEVARKDAIGADIEPWRAETSTRFLPGVRFDRDGPGTIGDVVVGVYPNEFAPDVPAIVRRTPETYRPPSIFYRLDESTRPLALSNRLTLGKLCPPVFDSETALRYVAVDSRLADFWEAFGREAESAGRKAEALKILRGFVSPNERQRLERLGVQLASFTRYQYGDAIAIIYDERGDFRMDDLNGDGTGTIDDVEVLAEWARAAMRSAGVSGGLGLEGSFAGPNHIGTPYLHVDLRGGGIVEWRTP